MIFMSWSNLGVCSTGRVVENERETREDDRKKKTGSRIWIRGLSADQDVR